MGSLTPRTFLASLNPTRWGRSSQSVSDRPLVTRVSINKVVALKLIRIVIAQVDTRAHATYDMSFLPVIEDHSVLRSCFH